jgi:hypothetical protein
MCTGTRPTAIRKALTALLVTSYLVLQSCALGYRRDRAARHETELQVTCMQVVLCGVLEYTKVLPNRVPYLI